MEKRSVEWFSPFKKKKKKTYVKRKSVVSAVFPNFSK